MYAKLIDGALNIAPKKRSGDGVIVYNLVAETIAVGRVTFFVRNQGVDVLR